MSCIVKDSRGRSPYWIASFTAADGRRLRAFRRKLLILNSRNARRQSGRRWGKLDGLDDSLKVNAAK